MQSAPVQMSLLNRVDVPWNVRACGEVDLLVRGTFSAGAVTVALIASVDDSSKLSSHNP